MDRLQSLSPIPIKVVWHKNRRTYLTIRKERECLHFRLHHLFLDAPIEVLESLIQMALKRDGEGRATVRKMAHDYFSQHKIAPRPLPTAGKTYDLLAIKKQIQQAHFSPEIDPAIGWSPGRIGRFRSMTFGTYDRQQNQVRINSLLDDSEVPLYFVEFIVYHEMLHAVCLPRMSKQGRCGVHTAEFRHKERQFPQYRGAKEWEKKSLEFFKQKNLKPKKAKRRRVLSWLSSIF